MIGFLHGKIHSLYNDHLILDVNGVGYKVIHNAPFRLGLEQSVVDLYIYTHVRETEISLYGFKQPFELKLFELLLSVSGVGPKTAMLVVSTHSPSHIVNAINQSDTTGLTVKGVGKKTLAKIVIELRGKLEKLNLSNIVSDSTENKDSNKAIEQLLQQQPEDDLFDALQGLGFTKNEYERIKSKIDSKQSFSEQVRQSLRLLRG